MSAVATGPARAMQFTNATADETTGPPVNCLGLTALTLYLTGTGTIASGVITIEEADWPDLASPPYGGTWSTIGTIDADDVTGGAQLAWHFGGPGGQFSYSWVRARISTAIGGGGNVSAVLVGV